MTPSPRIGIVVVAYNAATTLAWVLDRIPESFRPRIAAILVSDDHSHDDTESVGLEYKDREAELPLTIVRQPRNLGLRRQPEVRLPLGHRARPRHRRPAPRRRPVRPRGARRHGRPDRARRRRRRLRLPDDGAAARPPRAGCRCTSTSATGSSPASRTPSPGSRSASGTRGYRAYRVAALAAIPFERQQRRLRLRHRDHLAAARSGQRIAEVADPHLLRRRDLLRQRPRLRPDVMSDVVRYRLARIGLRHRRLARHRGAEYECKPRPTARHGRLLRLIGARPPGRVLDLGCGRGRLGEALRGSGHHVVGVDVRRARRTPRSGSTDFVVGRPRARASRPSVHEHGPYDVDPRRRRPRARP